MIIDFLNKKIEELNEITPNYKRIYEFLNSISIKEIEKNCYDFSKELKIEISENKYNLDKDRIFLLIYFFAKYGIQNFKIRPFAFFLFEKYISNKPNNLKLLNIYNFCLISDICKLFLMWKFNEKSALNINEKVKVIDVLDNIKKILKDNPYPESLILWDIIYEKYSSYSFLEKIIEEIPNKDINLELLKQGKESYYEIFYCFLDLPISYNYTYDYKYTESHVYEKMGEILYYLSFLSKNNKEIFEKYAEEFFEKALKIKIDITNKYNSLFSLYKESNVRKIYSIYLTKKEKPDYRKALKIIEEGIERLKSKNISNKNNKEIIYYYYSWSICTNTFSLLYENFYKSNIISKDRFNRLFKYSNKIYEEFLKYIDKKDNNFYQDNIKEIEKNFEESFINLDIINNRMDRVYNKLWKRLPIEFKVENNIKFFGDKRYSALNEITKRLYILLEVNKFNEKNVEELNNISFNLYRNELLYKYKFPELRLLYLEGDEIFNLYKIFIASLSLEEKKQEKGIFLGIMLLSFLPLSQKYLLLYNNKLLINNNDINFIFNDILKKIAKYFFSRKEYDRIRIMVQCIQSLPWYSQSFRTFKFPYLLSLYELILSLETYIIYNENNERKKTNILFYDDEKCNFINIFNALLNLTMDPTIISYLRNFQIGDIINKLDFYDISINDLEKDRRENFINYTNIYNIFFKPSFKQRLLLKFSQIEERELIFTISLGKDYPIILNKINELDNINEIVLNFLYEEELESYLELYYKAKIDNLSNSFFSFISPLTFWGAKCYNFSSFYEKDYNIIKEKLKELLKENKIISFTQFIPNNFLLNEDNSILISVIYFYNDNDLKYKVQITSLNNEELNELKKCNNEIKCVKSKKILKHFSQLYNNIINKKRKKLIWISNNLKFFPIQIQAINIENDKVWLEEWKSIEFLPFFRFLLISMFFPTIIVKDPYNREKVEYLRVYSKKLLGSTIFKQLLEIEKEKSFELIDEELDNLEKIIEVDENKFPIKWKKIPEIISYYGHIKYGNYLKELTGFSNNFFNILFILSQHDRIYPACKRIELWGCSSSKVFKFDSSEIIEEGFFSYLFLLRGAKRIIGTLKNVPDFTTALVCEYFSLNEKLYPDKSISLLLKEAILWTKDSLNKIKNEVYIKYKEWLDKNNNLTLDQISKKSYTFLKKIITDIINQTRLNLHNKLEKKFIFIPLNEEIIDEVLLKKGEIFLGRRKVNKEKRKADFLELIENIFKYYTIWENLGVYIYINLYDSDILKFSSNEFKKI